MQRGICHIPLRGTSRAVKLDCGSEKLLWNFRRNDIKIGTEMPLLYYFEQWSFLVLVYPDGTSVSVEWKVLISCAVAAAAKMTMRNMEPVIFIAYPVQRITKKIPTYSAGINPFRTVVFPEVEWTYTN